MPSIINHSVSSVEILKIRMTSSVRITFRQVLCVFFFITSLPQLLSARDVDSDNINDDVDSCPFDRENDKDSDNMCGAEECWDDPNFRTMLTGRKCDMFGFGDTAYGKCFEYQSSGRAPNACNLCPCMCAHEARCGYDLCPADAQNDVDKDGICGDLDICPLDKDNDVDSDEICGNVDTCSADAENDADSDNICGNKDSCQYDDENDADNDLICGDQDSCPYDALDDIDSDGLCGDLDTCPLDQGNDADGDKLCAATECFDDPKFGSDKGYACVTYAKEPNRCVPESVLLPSSKLLDVCTSCSCACANQVGCGFDQCPLDKENDVDSDNLCADKDVCPNDASNDVDSDSICGQVDSCPMDPENDVDGDHMCAMTHCTDTKGFISDSGGYTCGEYAQVKGYCKFDSMPGSDVCASCSCACADEKACGFDLDPCPHDPENDKDGDQMCADVDVCPLDKENDSDSDSLCADNDPCPNDASNDVDSDGICGQVDSCPMDRENDADSDAVCGDEDKCPHDAENDADNDSICAGS